MEHSDTTVRLVCWMVLLYVTVVTANEGDVRLRYGSSTQLNQGLVEVHHNGHWGTVCDDNFGAVDAGVVCRSLGYTGGEVMPERTYGQGFNRSPTIWLDEVRCLGNEARLIDCANHGWGTHDCAHREDVGIRCGGPLIITTPTTTKITTTSITTTSPPVLPDALCSITCDSLNIRVTLNVTSFRQEYLDVDPHSLSLSDSRCVGTPHDNDTLLMWTTGLDECDTQTWETDDHLIYSNVVVSYVTANNHTLLRDSNWKMNITCHLPRETRVSHNLGSVRESGATLGKATTGAFNLTMGFYRESEFQNEITNYPATVTLGHVLFCQISLQTSDPELNIFPVNVFGTVASHMSSAERYDLIEDMCVVDPDTHILPHQLQASRVSFKAFRFSGDDSSLFLHAELVVCRTAESTALCHAECNTTRQRRSVRDVREIYHVYQGPFIVTRGDALNISIH